MIPTTKLNFPLIGAVMRLSTKRVAIGVIALLIPFIPAGHTTYAEALPIAKIIRFPLRQNFVPIKTWTHWKFRHLPKEFVCLDRLINFESHWGNYARNSSSGAYGIFQFMPQTWANYGVTKTSDPYKQVDFGLHYIKVRYQSPCQALNWHLAKGWY